MTENDKHLHAYISGRVQGVFFRSTTRSKARTLGLTGWVKNLPDGRVEVQAEGSEKKLDEFEEFLHEGPRLALVEDVDSHYDEDLQNYNRFRVKR